MISENHPSFPGATTMFAFVCLIAFLNFALGYALAVQLGWAKWPVLRRLNAAASAATSDPHAVPPAKHGAHH
jgi:hypothetical protein